MNPRHLMLGWVVVVIGMALVPTQTKWPLTQAHFRRVSESLNPDVEQETVAGTIRPDNARVRMTHSNIEGILAFDRLNVWLSERASVEGVLKSIVLHSSDGGRTWMESFSTDKAEYFLSLQLLNREHVVAIATTLDWKNQLLRSLNGGESWNSLLEAQDLVQAQFIDAKTGWALGRDGWMYRTTNGGANWEKHRIADIEGLKSFHFSNGNEGWAVGDAGHVYQSTDGGINWIDRGRELKRRLRAYRPSKIDFEAVKFFSPKLGLVAAQFLVPRMEHRERVYYYHAVLFRTEDGGVTWKPYIASRDLGLSQVHFLTEKELWFVPFFDWRRNTILHSSDGGRSWKEMAIPDAGYATFVCFADPENGWLAFNNGEFLSSLYRTTTGGRSWEKLR